MANMPTPESPETSPERPGEPGVWKKHGRKILAALGITGLAALVASLMKGGAGVTGLGATSPSKAADPLLGAKVRNQEMLLGVEVTGPAGQEVQRHVITIGDQVLKGNISDPAFQAELRAALEKMASRYPGQSPQAPGMVNMLTIKRTWRCPGELEYSVQNMLRDIRASGTYQPFDTFMHPDLQP